MKTYGIILMFLIGSCRPVAQSQLTLDEATQRPITVMISNSSHLYVAVPATSTTVMVQQAETSIELEVHATIQGRKIFKSIAVFEPVDQQILNLSTSGSETFSQRIRFAKHNNPSSDPTISIPDLGTESSRKLVIVGTSAEGLDKPRDLSFNPKRQGELWVVNQRSEGAVIFQATGTDQQSASARTDAYANHFMSQVSSLAFGDSGTFATCQESRNEQRPIEDFMGPTLWSADLSIFAMVNQTVDENAECDGTTGNNKVLQGSHLDMLHQSPLCMGIAHIKDNAYWAFDGKNGNLVYYDFAEDHGPGRDDHSDGRVRRYSDVNLQRTEGVPSHMVVDKATGILYVAETSSGKVLKIDPKTARPQGRLSPRLEPLAEYTSYSGATVSDFAVGMKQPSGITIGGGRLFVSDHATGEIHAFELATGKKINTAATGAQGIMGLAIDANHKIWYVDSGANTVVRIDP